MVDLTGWQAVGWTLVLAVCLVILLLALALGAWFVTYAIVGAIHAASTPDTTIEKEPGA